MPIESAIGPGSRVRMDGTPTAIEDSRLAPRPDDRGLLSSIGLRS